MLLLHSRPLAPIHPPFSLSSICIFYPGRVLAGSGNDDDIIGSGSYLLASAEKETEKKEGVGGARRGLAPRTPRDSKRRETKSRLAVSESFSFALYGIALLMANYLPFSKLFSRASPPIRGLISSGGIKNFPPLNRINPVVFGLLFKYQTRNYKLLTAAPASSIIFFISAETRKFFQEKLPARTDIADCADI